MFEYFAPNEARNDAFLAASILFQPWRWRKGREVNNLKRRLKSRFLANDTTLSFYFSARGALYQYVKALQLPPDSQVCVSPTVSINVILCLKELGITPLYIDINTDLTMSCADLTRKCTQQSKLLILDHPCGITPAQRKDIIARAKSMKMPVLEFLDSGFDINLYRNTKFQTTLLWSFHQDSMLSACSGAVLAVRGKKKTELVKSMEKNIPNPTQIQLTQIVFLKLFAPIIKALNKIHLGRILHLTCRSFGLMPPEQTKKERKGLFDMSYLKTFPNLSAVFLFPQIDRFNDVSERRAEFIRSMNHDDRHALPVPESSLPMYPILVSEARPISAQTAFKKMKIHKPRSCAIYHDSHISLYERDSCPHAEKYSQELYIIPTNISEKQYKMIVQLLNGTE